jgi:hypothetical protein
VLDFGMIPVVPQKSNFIGRWQYDRALYKKHNEIKTILPQTQRLRPYLLPLRQASATKL